jgi:hypothetical protein
VCIAEMVEHMHEALHSIPVWQEESKVCWKLSKLLSADVFASSLSSVIWSYITRAFLSLMCEEMRMDSLSFPVFPRVWKSRRVQFTPCLIWAKAVECSIPENAWLTEFKFQDCYWQCQTAMVGKGLSSSGSKGGTIRQRS